MGFDREEFEHKIDEVYGKVQHARARFKRATRPVRLESNQSKRLRRTGVGLFLAGSALSVFGVTMHDDPGQVTPDARSDTTCVTVPPPGSGLQEVAGDALAIIGLAGYTLSIVVLSRAYSIDRLDPGSLGREKLELLARRDLRQEMDHLEIEDGVLYLRGAPLPGTGPHEPSSRHDFGP